MDKKIYIFIGTTAELIKIAPVIKELQRQKKAFKLIATGQNNINFQEMTSYLGDIRPDILFEKKSDKSSVISFFFWTIKTFFAGLFLLRKEFSGIDRKMSFLIVHGDTVSSMLGALIGTFYRLQIVHVESGLRSFNYLEPFPEEICRSIVSSVSALHFCPNEWAVNNVKRQKSMSVNTYENTLYESFLMAMKTAKKPAILKKIKKKYFVLVIHRQEHVIFGKEKTKKVFETILKNKDKSLQGILIMHDLTQSFLNAIDPALFTSLKKQFVILPRLSYIEFMKLLDSSEFLVTDGGSNQEEAYYMGKPCLILRNVTERKEGLGKNAVISKNDENIIIDFLKNYKRYEQKRLASNVKPAKIVVDYLIKQA